MSPGFEVLIDDRVRSRAVSLLRGLVESGPAHGIHCEVTPRYSGRSKVLIMWGAGDPLRNRWFNLHLREGGTAICWDMGYWHAGRGNEALGMNRVSVNAMHPQALVMKRALSAERFEARAVPVDDRWNRDGHVVLAGLGPKTCDQYSFRMGEWEQRKLAQIRAALPGRRIVFRPKPGNPYKPIGVEENHTDPIEQVLAGAYLAVCRHSNVAVDALRLGIPAAVDDGAAAAVFSAKLQRRRPVSNTTRRRFLRNLAWFQWSVMEAWAGEPWPFLKSLLP